MLFVRLVRKVLSVSFSLVEDFLRNISGPLGVVLRRAYYRRVLKSCGSNLIIDSGVYILNPQFIELGDFVYIDHGAKLIAGSNDYSDRAKVIENRNCHVAPGHIRIGNRCHLGIDTIIQGHGGVSIGDAFTTSAGCKIYSLSNDPKRCRHGTVESPNSPVYYVMAPVAIGHNVWLGLSVAVIGATIGDDCFAKPNSVISGMILKNSVVAGNPALKTSPRFEQYDS